MELRQLIYFIEVAKREHVTRAAEDLHVAQSAISRQISLLEAELGVTLFLREGRNVKLTPIGKVFLEHAEKVVNEINKAKQRMNEFLDPDTGHVRLGFSTGLSVQPFSALLAQFRKMHPNLQYQFVQGTPNYLTRLIENGELDLAISSPVPDNHPAVAGEILYMEKLMLLFRRDHWLSGQELIRLSQLKSEHFITFRSGFLIREMLVSACQQAGFEPAIAFEGEDMETIKGLVASGTGVAILPEPALLFNLSKEIVTAEISDTQFMRPVGVMVPKKREIAPSEKKLYEFLKSFYDRLNRFQR
ncbi:HTH-type transcriptional regulator GltC [Weizmannia acidilactici]|uniref:HTH-type transcriptional regulator GltC n=1 Tax=Weizmannia acidilactici TaxID=2607726 RepID=A0A5J4JCI5_9BACI|nr:LysR family transcriptional regulator [Weizmannia acidilactici]GER67173.1 HTH-type transcriptional regulator GltC [Weizmannia acidilactici]GER69683.1 HTH-type transcriptional regulator GltC [Weizmannia acidilactici]GER72496.1 HTH-type transcriptional regulator GltC [Weizmannia acidilactici]